MKTTDILKLNELRQRNMLSLFHILLDKAPLSRIELAQLSGCDNTSVTRSTRELLNRGLITPAGKADTGHGRPREQLIVNADSWHFLGIALEPMEICGLMTDFCGEPRVQERVRFAGSRSKNDYLDALASLTKSLLNSAQGRLAGTGVSTFGTSLDADGAVLHHTANFPELKGFDLRAFFQDTFAITPRFADMMLCSMNHEMNRHPEEHRGLAMLVHLGHGIGMSLAINGAVHFQRNQHGGELGHNICNPNGELCRCGRRGCLETTCSIDNFLMHLQQKANLSQRPSLAEAITRYHDGDHVCQELLDEAATFLAIALANQLNNLSPDHLVIGGPFLGFGKDFCADLESRIRALLFEFASRALTISFRGAEEECNPAIGAALLARTHLLDTPELFEKLTTGR